MRWPTVSTKVRIATALVAAASLGSVATYRFQRNRQRAAAKAEKDRAKAARVDNSYRERIAILQFTEALRAELAWHQASPRPATESAHRQHLARLRLARCEVGRFQHLGGLAGLAEDQLQAGRRGISGAHAANVPDHAFPPSRKTASPENPVRADDAAFFGFNGYARQAQSALRYL